MPVQNWLRVTKDRPCRICGKSGWCLTSRDGRAAICPRTSLGSVRDLGEAGYLHLADGIDFQRQPWTPPPPPRTREPFRDWTRYAQDCAERAHLHRVELAQILGVDPDVLTQLGVGYDTEQACWTVPERNGSGTIIGINRRFRDGSKRRSAGSQCGLTFADGWEAGTGPILLVEGASDTAALHTIQLTAIGRPSNTGGVSHLVDLLRNLSPDRTVIVLGERDQKPDGKWPGKDGAERTARQLAEKLRREIAWSLPPGEAKDARAWLNGLGRVPDAIVGEQFLAGLEPVVIPGPVFVPRTPLSGPERELGDWRDEMLSGRLASLRTPGMYLDRSTTGAGKSRIDLAVLQHLLQGGAT